METDKAQSGPERPIPPSGEGDGVDGRQSAQDRAVAQYAVDGAAIVHGKGNSLTFSEFVAKHFLPECLMQKKHVGRRHYQAILKHVLNPLEVDSLLHVDGKRARMKLKGDPTWPYLSGIPLVELDSGHVQRLISAAVDKGYSAQTAKHIRNVVRLIVSHAIRTKQFLGDDPTAKVILPVMQRREAHSLSISQAEELFR